MKVALSIISLYLESDLMETMYYIILPMENLPPINEMYATIHEGRDFGVNKKYQNSRSHSSLKVPPTKKGSFLDDEIKMSCSPGPANKANTQSNWLKKKSLEPKFADRNTFIELIQRRQKKNNSPSPSQYSLDFPAEKKTHKPLQLSMKTNFLDHSEYQSNMTPGPGSYLIATKIAKTVKKYQFMENHPRQPRNDKSADMNTYDPIPSEYNTFKKYEKNGKTKNQSQPAKTEPRKPEKENKRPGPGQYQMIHTWAVKKKAKKGEIDYLSKISKAPAISIYYH